MKIDITKKYCYRSGEPARILCVDAQGDQPVISLDLSGDCLRHRITGEFFTSNEESSRDLIEIRDPREWEIVVSTAENRSYKPGYIDGKATEDLQGGDKRIPADTWEIIKVREIL